MVKTKRRTSNASLARPCLASAPSTPAHVYLWMDCIINNSS